MVAGMASDYFMGMGFSKGIETSDEVRFIEDERVYVTRLAANGQPESADSFIVLDISELADSLTLSV